MVLIRAFLVWLVIIAAEMVHGILRGVLLVPIVGDLPARKIGVLIGALLIFAVAYLFIRWIAAQTKPQFLTVGLLWVVLADAPLRDRAGAARPWPALGADHRRLRRDPWRVHGGGAAVHGGSALAGGVVARVAHPRLGNRCVGRPWPHQVPAVAVQVKENGDGPILLDPRLLGEPDAPASHLVVVPPEIVGLEEQEHPPACLVAHPCRLFRGRRFRQQQCRAATARAHRHPAFAARKWGVLDREPQDLGEEWIASS